MLATPDQSPSLLTLLPIWVRSLNFYLLPCPSTAAKGIWFFNNLHLSSFKREEHLNRRKPLGKTKTATVYILFLCLGYYAWYTVFYTVDIRVLASCSLFGDFCFGILEGILYLYIKIRPCTPKTNKTRKKTTDPLDFTDFPVLIESRDKLLLLFWGRTGFGILWEYFGISWGLMKFYVFFWNIRVFSWKKSTGFFRSGLSLG